MCSRCSQGQGLLCQACKEQKVEGAGHEGRTQHYELIFQGGAANADCSLSNMENSQMK